MPNGCQCNDPQGHGCGYDRKRIEKLERALRQIVNAGVRVDRRHRGMVDRSIVEDLQRIAMAGLAR